jgi:hypothetical protein
MGRVEDPLKIDDVAILALALSAIKMRISSRLGVHFKCIITGILIPKIVTIHL